LTEEAREPIFLNRIKTVHKSSAFIASRDGLRMLLFDIITLVLYQCKRRYCKSKGDVVSVGHFAGIWKEGGGAFNANRIALIELIIVGILLLFINTIITIFIFYSIL
jgi:hypothetical protein